MNQLMKRTPVSWLALPREIDRMYDELFNNLKTSETFPKFQTKVTDEHLVIQFALAGFPRDKLNIEVRGDVITVKGDKVDDDSNLFAGRAFTWSRRDVQGIWNFDQSEVKYEDGMLTIKAPKKEELKPKLLEIK